MAHDSHHLLVAGTSTADMALAVNTLAHTGGGVAVVRAGAVIALIELPVGGLMSYRTRRGGGREVGAGDAGDA